MKKYKIENIEYELVKNYKDGFVLEEITSKVTDYFEPYDYIVGDWAYGKLRLKGFCDPDNKIYKKWNDINKVDDYRKENCSYDCKFFILKKVKN